MPIFDPSDLLGRSFLMDPSDNGECHRAKILEAIVEDKEQLANHPDHVKYYEQSMMMRLKRYSPIMRYSSTSSNRKR